MLTVVLFDRLTGLVPSNQIVCSVLWHLKMLEWQVTKAFVESKQPVT